MAGACAARSPRRTCRSTAAAAERFDDLVLEAVAQLEPRWEAELAGRRVRRRGDPGRRASPEDDPEPGAAGPARSRLAGHRRSRRAPARPARIVLYRRPLLARADGEEDLGELVLDVVVEEFARLLGAGPARGRPGLPGRGLTAGRGDGRASAAGHAGAAGQPRAEASELRTAGSGTQVSELGTGRIDRTMPFWLTTRPA